MEYAVTEAQAAVPPEEVERRIAEYRRVSFERRLPAQVVYSGSAASCPWPGCDLRIAGIRFELETMGNSEQASRWLAAWWNGPGLVGRCPACTRHVLFEVTGKKAVTDLARLDFALLPEDWHLNAYIVTRPQ